MEAEDIARGVAPGPPRTGMVPVSIIGAEDEDFENELETNAEEQNSQFQNLEQVKRRPAHLMCLLQHVALQFDPGPLLCCLHADMAGSLGPKEAKKAFLDFYHSFLEKTAVLRVPVPSTVAFELDRTRPDLLSEDVQRQFMQEVVQSLQDAVSRQLEDFRSKRLMGMTPSEHELAQLEVWVGRDRASLEARERHVAERLLAQLEEMQHTISTDEEKSAAVLSAISLYMRHLGVRTKSGDKKSGRNFFRKKVMGNRRSDEPSKTKKGLSSFLDPARWNRGETPVPDFRHLKIEADAEKSGLAERRGGLGIPSRDRNVGAPGQDTPGVSLHPLSSDIPDRESGGDAPLELGDLPPQGVTSLEPPAPLESTEEGADTERMWKRLSGRLGRSESLRVSDRRRPSRGSLGAKGRGGGRSRSDVDMDPSSATAVLGPTRRATPEPGDDGEPGRAGLELEPEEPPGWRDLVPPGTLLSMPKSQVKRQEVISELLVTEAAHVRMLRVLHDLFYQPMAEGGFFPLEELQNIFPSLDELIEVHSLFLDRLMKRRQDSGFLIEEIGDVLLARPPILCLRATQIQTAQGTSVLRLRAGGREPPAVPPPAAEGHDPHRDAAADQVPPPPAEHRTEHRRACGAGEGGAGGRVLPGDPAVRQPIRTGHGGPAEAQGISAAPGPVPPAAEQRPHAKRVQEPGHHQEEAGPRGPADLAGDEGQVCGGARAAAGRPAAAAAAPGRAAAAQVPQQDADTHARRQDHAAAGAAAHVGHDPRGGHRSQSLLRHFHLGPGGPDLRAGGTVRVRAEELVRPHHGDCWLPEGPCPCLPPQTPAQPKQYPRTPAQQF
ncbi:PREDICTED: rho guanine nucleotide exchange factor 1 isoform X4 [Condylura cristata]|uniref:rho guanine nucleotide exchange factor 1 isoform X4 n=1 Tax=Condylura cristata TaxID=143302 RepID=UPI000643A136|nr:PREDICTED: rho guanine nucleotide exchange factor 1 isoform X4 [Condylura cristata]